MAILCICGDFKLAIIFDGRGMVKFNRKSIFAKNYFTMLLFYDDCVYFSQTEIFSPYIPTLRQSAAAPSKFAYPLVLKTHVLLRLPAKIW